MPKEYLLLAIFSGFFLAPMVVALGLGWLAHHRQIRRAALRKELAHKRRNPTTLTELKCMAEFQRRWRRTLSWSWSGWLAAAMALFALGLPLTAFALATLVPFLALMEHHRCPACETTATLRGLTVGRSCRRCGVRLKP